MTSIDGLMMFPASVAPKAQVQKRVETSAIGGGRPALVLDMGEASREEGFRVNGCR